MQKRFTRILHEPIITGEDADPDHQGVLEIIRDNETGIEYLIVLNGRVANGITPLLSSKDRIE